MEQTLDAMDAIEQQARWETDTESLGEREQEETFGDWLHEQGID